MTIRSLVMFVAVAGVAVSSFAAVPRLGGGSDTIEVWSESESYDLGSYLDNPCTAVLDRVWVDYKVELTKNGKSTSSSHRVIFDERTSVSGVAYTASGATTTDVTYQEKPYTIRKYHKVKTADDFHVVTVIDFDPARRKTNVSVETACGNGLPDSAE